MAGATAAVGTNISSKKGNCTLLLLAKLSFSHFTFTFNPYTATPLASTPGTAICKLERVIHFNKQLKFNALFPRMVLKILPPFHNMRDLEKVIWEK